MISTIIMVEVRVKTSRGLSSKIHYTLAANQKGVRELNV